jgi:hypothetical protein
MGGVKRTGRVLRIAAVFSRHAELFGLTQATLRNAWGPISLASDPFPFDYTTYYDREMGANLQKCFWAFDLAEPADLADWKIQTNALELELSQRLTSHEFQEARPLNIDPGYVTEAKLVLATTKDRDHRIYLRDGIFAEVTLYFHKGEWRTRPWTYPDYSDSRNIPFFEQCRDHLRSSLRKT